MVAVPTTRTADWLELVRGNGAVLLRPCLLMDIGIRRAVLPAAALV